MRAIASSKLPWNINVLASGSRKRTENSTLAGTSLRNRSRLLPTQGRGPRESSFAQGADQLGSLTQSTCPASAVPLSEIAQRVRVRLAQDRAELCVASEPLRKILPVLYPQCSDKRIAPLVSDLAVPVSAAIVEPIVTVLTHVLLRKILSRAPARTPTTPTPITRAVPRHDAAAEAAGGSVAEVDDSG